MFDSIIASLLIFGPAGRQNPIQRRPAGIPDHLAHLDDHTLRDMGFARDRIGGQRRHLMRF